MGSGADLAQLVLDFSCVPSPEITLRRRSVLSSVHLSKIMESPARRHRSLNVHISRRQTSRAATTGDRWICYAETELVDPSANLN